MLWLVAPHRRQRIWIRIFEFLTPTIRSPAVAPLSRNSAQVVIDSFWYSGLGREGRPHGGVARVWQELYLRSSRRYEIITLRFGFPGNIYSFTAEKGSIRAAALHLHTLRLN